jgi:hypothetical protein
MAPLFFFSLPEQRYCALPHPLTPSPRLVGERGKIFGERGFASL